LNYSLKLQKNPQKVDENEIGRAKNMTDTDVWRIFSAYQCEEDYEETKPESRSTLEERKPFSNIF